MKIILVLLVPCWQQLCHPLITFANILDPDQDRQNVGPDLQPTCMMLTSLPSELHVITRNLHVFTCNNIYVEYSD